MCNNCGPHGNGYGYRNHCKRYYYGNIDSDEWEMDYVNQRQYYRPVRWVPPTPEEEKTYIEEELVVLKNQMESLQKRLDLITKK